MDEEFKTLKEVAMRLAKYTVLTEFVYYGHVGCALLTDKGNVYTGVSINAKCGIGFCAEHAAIADMIKAGESRIVKLVSASADEVLVPCGRCREFIRQVNYDNLKTKILINDNEVKTIDELLPYTWSMKEVDNDKWKK